MFPPATIGVGAREIGYLYASYRRMRNGSNFRSDGQGASYGASLCAP